MKDREYRYSTLHDLVYGVIDCGNYCKEHASTFNSHPDVVEKNKETAYAVIHAGEEFKRRYLDKREDTAIQENGDIL